MRVAHVARLGSIAMTAGRGRLVGRPFNPGSGVPFDVGGGATSCTAAPAIRRRAISGGGRSRRSRPHPA